MLKGCMDFLDLDKIKRKALLYVRVRTGPGKPGKSWNFNIPKSRPGNPGKSI
jgi:hypothetical protein